MFDGREGLPENRAHVEVLNVTIGPTDTTVALTVNDERMEVVAAETISRSWRRLAGERLGSCNTSD